jgi:signal transduction histidine kinase
MRLSERQINLLAGGAVVALLPLAWLQYRWISEVSEADQQRRMEELKGALERIARETDLGAGRVHAALIGPPGGDDFPLEERLRGYRPAEDAVPIREVFRIREAPEGLEAERWDSATERMVRTAVPGWWTERSPGEGPIQGNPPALLGPAFDEESGETGFLVLELDAQKVLAEYLPRVIGRHVGAGYLLQEYATQVTAVGEAVNADASVGLFRRVDRGVVPPAPGRGAVWRKKGAPGKKKGGPFGLAVVSGVAGGGIWMLHAVHRSGSLDAKVERTRMRNLIVSGVTLLFLALAMLAVGHALRRSQRLARMQLEFTAGVSHELRTPLAVIVSAGDNLAGGYVKEPARVREYGALVRDEGTRLTAMVDQVLRFSEYEADRMPLERRALLISDVLENLEREMRPIVERQGAEWEMTFENATLSGDAAALHTAVRNLAENALRHGGGKWVGVRAAGEGGAVTFTVEDKGPGISPVDLPHLFEPFYRGVDSRAQQRKGSGLGLALVDRIARAHGGSVKASNRPDGGARFVLTIPGE